MIYKVIIFLVGFFIGSLLVLGIAHFRRRKSAISILRVVNEEINKSKTIAHKENKDESVRYERIIEAILDEYD